MTMRLVSDPEIESRLPQLNVTPVASDRFVTLHEIVESGVLGGKRTVAYLRKIAEWQEHGIAHRKDGRPIISTQTLHTYPRFTVVAGRRGIWQSALERWIAQQQEVPV